MATTLKKKNKNGTFRYQIGFKHGKRRSVLSLGSKYSPNQVKMIALYVGKLERVIETGDEPDRSLQTFLDEMADDLRERFERAGLLEESTDITNAELWDRFTDDPNGRKDSTLRTYETVRKRFLAFFDPDDDPDDITEEDGEAWREALRDQYAEATVAGCFQRTRTVFHWAVKNHFMNKEPVHRDSEGVIRQP